MLLVTSASSIGQQGRNENWLSWPQELKRLLKESEQQIPRRLKPPRDDNKIKGFDSRAKVRSE